MLAVQLLLHPLPDSLGGLSPLYSEPLTSPRIDSLPCANPQAFLDQLPICKMSVVLQAAKSVAAEFEYGTEALNKGVKEFIREMG